MFVCSITLWVKFANVLWKSFFWSDFLTISQKEKLIDKIFAQTNLLKSYILIDKNWF